MLFKFTSSENVQAKQHKNHSKVSREGSASKAVNFLAKALLCKYIISEKIFWSVMTPTMVEK